LKNLLYDQDFGQPDSVYDLGPESHLTITAYEINPWKEGFNDKPVEYTFTGLKRRMVYITCERRAQPHDFYDRLEISMSRKKWSGKGVSER
jgi:hypothetical protein